MGTDAKLPHLRQETGLWPLHLLFWAPITVSRLPKEPLVASERWTCLTSAIIPEAISVYRWIRCRDSSLSAAVQTGRASKGIPSLVRKASFCAYYHTFRRVLQVVQLLFQGFSAQQSHTMMVEMCFKSSLHAHLIKSCTFAWLLSSISSSNRAPLSRITRTFFVEDLNTRSQIQSFFLVYLSTVREALRTWKTFSVPGFWGKKWLLDRNWNF